MRPLALLLPLLLLVACDGAADRAPVVIANDESCVLPTSLPAPEMERVRDDEVVAARQKRG